MKRGFIDDRDRRTPPATVILFVVALFVAVALVLRTCNQRAFEKINRNICTEVNVHE